MSQYLLGLMLGTLLLGQSTVAAAGGVQSQAISSRQGLGDSENQPPSAAPIEGSALSPESLVAQTANPASTGLDETAIPAGYAFGSGDQIAIEVFGYEEFTGSWVVLPDGNIMLPLVGAVPVAGKTPESLEILLAQQLNNFLVDPVVAVRPTVLRPVVVTVAGEVQRPGPVQLRSLSEVNINRQSNEGNRGNTGSQAESRLDSIPTVSSALVEAGGVTRNADIRQVVLRRSQPGRETISITLNLWEALFSETLPEDLVLQDGDAIFVPQLSAEDTLDRRLLARSSLSPTTIPVRVVGQVEDPGEVVIAPDSSLSGAIAAAGGPTTDARLRQVQLIRLDNSGQVEQRTIDLSALNDDNQVQTGDVIFVPERRSSRAMNMAGRVLSPVLSVFQGLGIIERLLDD